MADHTVASREEWLEARKQLLAEEKQLTRLKDDLARRRRELPWVKVEADYVFEGPGGQTTLDLRTFGVAGVPAPPRGAEIQVEAASAAAMQAANAAADAAAGNAQAPDEARRIEDIRRRIEARRAQMRSQNPETNDGGARPRPLSGPAR